jgi:hypothetical protein
MAEQFLVKASFNYEKNLFIFSRIIDMESGFVYVGCTEQSGARAAAGSNNIKTLLERRRVAPRNLYDIVAVARLQNIM